MPRPEKVQAVADIKERIEGANAVFLAEYAGLSVKEQQELRRSLRANGAEFKVVKMTLTRRAAAELDLDSLDELLIGPTGLTFADGDPVSAAKALDDFANSHEVFTVKGGLLGRDFLAPERVQELAKIEPREVLLAKLAGAFQAPMANMAGLLAALPRGFATAMSQLIDQKTAAVPDDADIAVEDTTDDGDATEAAESESENADADTADPAEVQADDAAEPEASAADEAAAEASDEDVTEEAAADGDDESVTATSDDDDEPAATAEEE